MRRTLHNYYIAARGVSRRQRLTLPPPDRKPAVRVPFVLTDAEREAWDDLYLVPPNGAVPLPFSYYAQTTVDEFHAFIDSMRLNFRNVLHLQWQMEAARPGAAALRPATAYQVELGLDDVAWLKRDRAILACYVNVLDQSGEYLLRTAYHFLIKNLSSADVAMLKAAPGYNRQQFPELLAVSRTGEVIQAIKNPRTHSLRFSSDMGLRYGRVSGDMNIVHVNRWLVRLFGYSRTFAQGMCTANYIMRTLAVDERIGVDRFTITFCRPVFLPSTPELHLSRGSFQLRDESNALAALGTWSSAATAGKLAGDPAESRRLSRESMAVAMVVR
jgi:acyl dehydratase